MIPAALVSGLAILTPLQHGAPKHLGTPPPRKQAAQAPTQTRASTPPVTDPPAAETAFDLLLVDVLYERLRLDTAMPALQDEKGRRYLPMKQLSKAVGFRLWVNPSRRMVSGFL